MLALRWHGRGDVRLDDIPAPEPPPSGWLQLEVIACGICGTDVEEYLHGPTFIPHAEPNRLTGAVAPIVLGHEIAGRVVAVGLGTPDFAIGDVVGVDGLMGCGRCSSCSRGAVNLCDSLAAVGLMSDGGLAERVNVRADTCVKIPAGAAADTGALAETLAVAVRALRRGRLAEGERVVIFGAGAVGLFALQAARAMGASQVAVVEPHAHRRALALELGASAAWPPGAEVGEADVVVECSGVPDAFAAALSFTRRGGRLVLVGVSTVPVAVSPMDIVAGEREVIGSLSHLRKSDFAAAVELLVSGAVRTDGIVSSRIPLAHALDDGLLALVREPERHVKILVVPPTSDEAVPERRAFQA
ncbi:MULTISPECIES: alcohol dehydrogenase catalytic domain-containing protein [Microbacterium]|uniref:zinc-binding dehydrogenase n=1 Tax=Microbacterium TaxID=33882 RepID=UPI001469D82F|nr:MULTISPECIES: alcohol dehydrogenase catalytic domain-containing protein [Microbacterium]